MYGVPTTPTDLIEHNCLRYLFNGQPLSWEFLINGVWRTVPVRGSFNSDNGGALKNAALARLGITRLLGFQLKPQSLQKVAAEAIEIDTSRLELVTEFRARDPQIEQTLMMLRAELHQGGGWVGQLYVESLANVLAVHLLRQYSTTQPRVALYEGGLGDRYLFQVTEYINAHLEENIKADLAELVGISQFHFSRLFKQSMKVSLHQYLFQQRVERATQLLKTTKYSVAKIALQCGFNSHRSSESTISPANRDDT